MAKQDKKVNDWMAEIEIARKIRQEYLRNWTYWEGVYDDKLWGAAGLSGKRRATGNDPQFIPQVNELESIVNNIVPKIIFSPPVFEITADIEEYRLSAMLYEKLAEVLYERLGLEDTATEAAVDCLLLGGGLHKTGYYYEVETLEYTLGDATAGEPETRQENVISAYVSPLNVLWDYSVKRWGDKRWFAEEIRKPLAEVKKSGMYRNVRDLKGTLDMTKGIIGLKRQAGRKEENKSVLLIEIHDLAHGKIITIAEGHGKVLREIDDYGIELYDQLTFTPSRPSRFWGKSIAQSIEEHLIRLAKTAYYMDSHARRGGLTKIMVDNARVNKMNLEKLRSKNDFELIAVDGLVEGGPPVQELKFSQLGMDWFAQTNLIEETIRMLSGVTMQERGRHEPGVETAFETAKLFEASDTRNRERIKRINKFIQSIMSKMLRIVSDNWPPEKICAEVGVPSEYAYMLLPFDKMQLRVKFGSTAMSAREEQRNKILLFAQIMGAAGIPLNPIGFGKLVSESLGLELRENVLLASPGAGAAGGTQPPTGSPSAPGQAASGGGGNANLPIQM